MDCQSSFKEESCEFWAKHSTAESPLLLHWGPPKQKAYHNVKCWNIHRTVTVGRWIGFSALILMLGAFLAL